MILNSKVFFTLFKPKHDARNHLIFSYEGRTIKRSYDKKHPQKLRYYYGKDPVTGVDIFEEESKSLKTDVLMLVEVMIFVLSSCYSEKKIKPLTTSIEVDFHLEKGSSWRILENDFIKLRKLLNKHPDSYSYGMVARYKNEKQIKDFFQLKDAIMKEYDLEDLYVQVNLNLIDESKRARRFTRFGEAVDPFETTATPPEQQLKQA